MQSVAVIRMETERNKRETSMDANITYKGRTITFHELIEKGITSTSS
jgi:hypothetical protein